ncbi:MauE/DoxX family redox-associated membrane protein [Flavobacterium pectinovorum]|uniref:MauE/DoxX family redox-associated membrane protein n=1 Tax=Flavobacterium pectinovorum TaxID=29533 RepID=UPI001FAC1116|nr:MauE/DoxX family redox-associated membrane protein [Flavobacterium pectinovorum]MCI9843606.1 DoxX family protein [Flavobacterium pectinovorum]
MKSKINIKSVIIESICLLYILLFVYAALSKLLDFENFQTQLGQSPILSLYAEFFSISVIVIELVMAIFISIPKVRYLGLWGAVVLMSMFTAYIVIILNFSSFIPCSCGGILEKLGWTAHLIFNLGFLILGITAIRLNAKSNRIVIPFAIAVLAGVIFVTALFLFSEDIMEKENPFIRRFPNASAAKTDRIDLRNFSYYIIGADKDKIYLANRLAPLQILEVDSDFKNKKSHTITLDRENFKFRTVEVRLNPPYFYVIDGSVPVIYRGLISTWKAKVISDGKFRFSDIIFHDGKQAFIRTQKQYTGENILGLSNNYTGSEIQYNKGLLEKQIDGIFDTDGTMQYSRSLRKLIYVYYYRNEYIAADENLKLQYRANTIDTTSKAKLKVVKLKQSGDTKLAAPPYMVNRHTTLCDNLLFVNSLLRGRYEGNDVWKHATAVDVYDISKQHYILSFYVYDEEGFRMNNFFAADSAMYIISGHYLLKYGYGKNLKSKFKK